jgi:hypothetical protein
MNVKTQQLINRADNIYRNKIAFLYKDKHPDIDMNQVKLPVTVEMEAILEAIVEIIDSKIYQEPRM